MRWDLWCCLIDEARPFIVVNEAGFIIMYFFYEIGSITVWLMRQDLIMFFDEVESLMFLMRRDPSMFLLMRWNPSMLFNWWSCTSCCLSCLLWWISTWCPTKVHVKVNCNMVPIAIASKWPHMIIIVVQVFWRWVAMLMLIFVKKNHFHSTILM